jgi:RNA polymerase sigma factor (sigma-70 family)
MAGSTTTPTNRDPNLRERIILAYLGLADRLADRYRHSRGTTPEDLRQTARAGLIAAVDRYDPDYGDSFVAYAVVCVVGELKRHLRDSSWRLHVPRPLKEQALGRCQAADQLQQTLAAPRASASWPSACRWPRSRCWRRWRSPSAAKNSPWTVRLATTPTAV